jgi:predicted RNA-binding protein with PUA-like domain
MVLLRKGSRLSIQPVTTAQFRHIAKLAKSTEIKKPLATRSNEK